MAMLRIPPPDTLSCARRSKYSASTNAPDEGRIERMAHVGGQNCHAAITVHTLQQVTDFQVGVAIMAVAYFAAFAEKGIRLVEQENRAAFLGGVEDAAQVLLGL